MANDNMKLLEKRAEEAAKDQLKSRGVQAKEADSNPVETFEIDTVVEDMWNAVVEVLDRDRDGYVTPRDLIFALKPLIPIETPDNAAALLHNFSSAIEEFVVRTGTRVADLYRRWTLAVALTLNPNPNPNPCG